MTRKALLASGTVLLVALATTAVGAISASADRATEGTGSTLVGSWIMTVNRGPALPPVKSLQTFAEGGGMVTAQNFGPTTFGPAHGAWKRTGARAYATTFMFFSYDPSGAQIGTTKLRRTLDLAPHSRSLTSVCSPEFRNGAGELEPGSNVHRDLGTGERVDNAAQIPSGPAIRSK